jgi:hypothetical protein
MPMRVPAAQASRSMLSCVSIAPFGIRGGARGELDQQDVCGARFAPGWPCGRSGTRTAFLNPLAHHAPKSISESARRRTALAIGLLEAESDSAVLKRVLTGT